MNVDRIDAMLEPEERVLSTLNKDGTRRWLRPRPASGKWLLRRKIVGYALIALFASLPYIRIGGKPAVLLDLARREFTLFGTTLYATDTVLLALAMLSIFVTIFLLTALFGRVWCGWGCPQTVYLELVYRPIERLFEGRHYKTAGRTPLAAWRQVGKYATFLVISLLLSHIFLAYFVGTEQLWAWMHQSPLAHPSAFLLVFAVTALMMFDFAYMREQVCILMCPYGRLQSALLDQSSMIVAYDTRRGEPRGKRRKGAEGESFGDCIDCFKCVTTCPTGIDIRDGLQMECVQCTQCIDACDDVMEHIGRPKGLIRYGSQNAMAGEKKRGLRPRLVIYPLILATTLSLFGLAIGKKDAFDATFLRSRNMTYQLADDGSVTNVVQLKIKNRSDVARSYTVELDGESSVSSNDLPLMLDARATGEATLRIASPKGSFVDGRAEIVLRVTEDSGEVIEMKRQVLGPLFGSSEE